MPPSHSHLDFSIPNQVCHCSKPEGVDRDIPDKQGDDCLQPTSQNYQHFLFSLEAMLEVLFGNFVWIYCLDV